MIKLEQIALELLEFKVANIEAGEETDSSGVPIWDLHHFLEQEFGLLSSDEQLRLETVSASLKRHAFVPSKPKSALDTFDALVLDSFSGFEGLMSPVPQSDLANPSSLLDEGSEPSIDETSFSDDHVSFDFSLEGLSSEASTNALSDFSGFGFEDNKPAATLTDNPAFEKEQQILQRLASKVWWHNMEEVIQQLAIRCRVEKDRSMSRLLYALSRNLERYMNSPEQDVTTIQPKVLIAVTDYDDPLVSFNNLETLNILVRDVVEIIMDLSTNGSLHEDAHLDKELTLDFVKRLTNAIVKDPYMGKLGSIESKGPSSEQIKIAIQELGKERLRDDQKQKQQEQLEARLQTTLMQEKHMENLFKQDVEKFTNAAHVFFEQLEPYLPKRVGGPADDPSLAGGVLFATNPVLNLSQVPKKASAISIQLSGPLRLAILDHEIGLSPMDGSLLVLIYNFREQDYIHLMIQDNSSSLAMRLAESLAILFILSSEYKASLLSILRTTATLTMGDSQTLISNAIRRLNELSANTPSRRQTLEGLVKGAAKAKGLTLPENVSMSLINRLISAMTVSPDQLTVTLESADHSEAYVHKLSDDPLNII